MIKFIIKSILNKTYFYKKINKKNFSFFINISSNKVAIKNLLKNKKTPFFVADKKIIYKSYYKLKNSLDKNWGKNNLIAYSFKTNYSVIKDVFFKKNFLAEVVSEDELLIAIKSNYKKIIYNGPNKSINSLKKSAKLKAIVNIDNWSEIKTITKLTKQEQKLINWGIRLKINKESRFGFSIFTNEAELAIKQLNKNKINLSAIHIHLGTNIYELNKYKQAAIELVKFIKKNKLNKKIKYIDFGGGFPSHAPQPNDEFVKKTPRIDEYVKVITNELKKIFIKNKKPTLILEPGRFIVEDAQILITKVCNINNYNKNQLVVCNATNNILPLAHYRPQIVKIFDQKFKEKTLKKTITKVFGASCQEDDLLFSGKLPKITENDLIIFFAVGAYNSTIGGDFIFKKPKLFFI